MRGDCLVSYKDIEALKARPGLQAILAVITLHCCNVSNVNLVDESIDATLHLA